MSNPSQFPCGNCGAALEWAPGKNSLLCPWCGTANAVPEGGGQVAERDFLAALADRSAVDATVEQLTVRCDSCGAESALGPGITADRCPFCGTAMVAQAASRRAIKPDAVVPFKVSADDARRLFDSWVSSLWLAPGDLARLARVQGLRGAYLPYWTYDCHTDTVYAGERGENYTVTETYTATETRTSVVDGRTVTQSVPVTRTRTVTRIRWYPVRGRVARIFDDLLVTASMSLPPGLLQRLEPWVTSEAVPYADHYLAGFVAESYQTDLAAGFERAKAIIEADIKLAIRRDIGGDHQRIHSMATRYSNITFKHLLLPLWISAFRYRERAYRFLVNGQTGRVAGERPYSVAKVILLITLIAALVAAAVALWNWRV